MTYGRVTCGGQLSVCLWLSQYMNSVIWMIDYMSQLVTQCASMVNCIAEYVHFGMSLLHHLSIYNTWTNAVSSLHHLSMRNTWTKAHVSRIPVFVFFLITSTYIVSIYDNSIPNIIDQAWMYYVHNHQVMVRFMAIVRLQTNKHVSKVKICVTY
jgi:hypothetical protein